MNGDLRLIHTEHHNVALVGGTFDLFDEQNGLRTHLTINVAFTLMVSDVMCEHPLSDSTLSRFIPFTSLSLVVY